MGSASRMLLVLMVLATTLFMGVRAPAQARRPAGPPTGSTARFTARWVGQDGQDWTGAGPSVGPDGLQDVHIQLSDLPAGVAVKAARWRPRPARSGSRALIPALSQCRIDP